jgi:uncharacterized membrane protein YeaQ/YmgE (transglycosylase-associated protein family)
MRKKGQLSIINVISWCVLCIIGAVMTPILVGFMDMAQSSVANYSAGQMIIGSVIVIYWLGIIITFFVYVTPSRRQEY